MARKVKVAVVGSGLAGLTAAYLLSKPSTWENDVEFELHLFEKASVIGMDSSSISLPVAGRDMSWRVDVPMRSFQGGYYPQLIALYKRLGVAFREADFSYSFSLLSSSINAQQRQINATMIYNGASGLAGLSMPSVLDEAYQRMKGRGVIVRFATKAWIVGVFVLVTMQLMICYLRTIFYSMPMWRPDGQEGMSFGDWAEETLPRSLLARWSGMDLAWGDYTRNILLPLFSAVCTAPGEDVLLHPVEEFLDYIWLTLGTHHYVVLHGVRDVVSRLTSSVQHIHLSTTISAIHPDDQNPDLTSIYCSTPQGSIVYAGFHHIIFATQAIHAIPLLSSYGLCLQPKDPKRLAVEEQVHCLQTFEYRPTIVINHTDATLLPDVTSDRRDLNLVCLDPEATLDLPACTKGNDGEDESAANYLPPSYTMATHVLAPPAGYPSHLPTIYQTTNPIIPPKNECLLSVAKLERAILTIASKKALKKLHHEEGRQWWQCSGQGSSRLGDLQGAGRLSNMRGPGLWICGSFAYAGIPLLEGCVVSARNVVEQGILKSEGIEPQKSPW